MNQANPYGDILLSFNPEATYWLVKVGKNLVGGVARRLFCGFITAHR